MAKSKTARARTFDTYTTEQHERLKFLPFVPAIRTRSSDLVFVSGVIGVPDDYDPAAPLVSVPIEIEAERVFARIRETLALAGADLGDVVRITKYMTDLDEHAGVVTVMRRFFGDHLPTSTTIEVKRLVPRGFRLEVDAIAAVGAEPSQPTR
ncbi:RidA family protein [Methylibium sp.]|uniref:RidA family protein n=1 Tax=Methylibium sp. TaxID=2067992 RepID=UPI003D0F9892